MHGIKFLVLLALLGSGRLQAAASTYGNNEDVSGNLIPWKAGQAVHYRVEERPDQPSASSAVTLISIAILSEPSPMTFVVGVDTTGEDMTPWMRSRSKLGFVGGSILQHYLA